MNEITITQKLAEVKKQMNKNLLTAIENEVHPSIHPRILLNYQAFLEAENNSRQLDKSAPWRYTGPRRQHHHVKKLRYQNKRQNKLYNYINTHL